MSCAAVIKVVPYDARFKSTLNAFGQVSSDEQGLYEISLPCRLPSYYEYRVNFWVNGAPNYNYNLTEADMSPGKVITKDVVIQPGAPGPTRLQLVR